MSSDETCICSSYTVFTPALRQCSNAFRTNLRLECIPKAPGFRPKEQLLRESGTPFELDRLRPSGNGWMMLDAPLSI